MKIVKGYWYKRNSDNEEFYITEISKTNGRYDVYFSHPCYTGVIGMSLADFSKLLAKGFYEALGFLKQVDNKYGQKEDVYYG